MSLASELRGVHRIGIDSNAFIDYAEGKNGANILSELFDRLEKGALTGVVSMTVLPEVLMTVRRDANRDEETAYRRLLALCEMVPVTEEVAEEALVQRANFNLKTVDAIHLATALCTRCDAIISNDAKDFGRVQNALPLPHAPERMLRVIIAKNL